MTEALAWEAIRRADLPDDRIYEVVATGPEPLCDQMSIDVYVPAGPSRGFRVGERDTVEQIVSSIEYAATMVVGANSRLKVVRRWYTTGNPSWENWATTARVAMLQEAGLRVNDVRVVLGRLGPDEQEAHERRILQDPDYVLAVQTLLRQLARDDGRGDE